MRVHGGRAKNGSQTRTPDAIAAAVALDINLLVAYMTPDGAGPLEVDMRGIRLPVQARRFDQTDGSWRAVADALPNGGPHAIHRPGRYAAKKHNWVLVAAPTRSSPQR